MEVKKDGNVWIALNRELDICVSGDTKEEAIANLEQASVIVEKIRDNHSLLKNAKKSGGKILV